MDTTRRSLIVLLGSAVTAAAGLLSLLAWDDDYYTGADGYQHGPYET